MAAKREFKITTPNASGIYLEQLRASKGLTRKQAAERIGCSTSTLARYEKQGVSGQVRLRRVFNLTKAYGISADELYERAMHAAGTERSEI